MKRRSFFTVTKEKKEKKQRNSGISYRRGSFKDNQYVFFQPSESEDEGEEEIFVLRAKRPPEKFIERVLQPGDTLLNIAVQYGYSVGELKRINHIHKDNEIYARTTLKVPLRITETAAVHSVIKETQEKINEDSKLEDKNECDNRFRTVSISDAYRESKLEGNDADAARRFLAAMDQDLARIRESATSKEQTASYEFNMTGIERENSLTGPFGQSSNDSTRASNWNWVHLLIYSLLLVFVISMVYVLYTAEEADKRP